MRHITFIFLIILIVLATSCLKEPDYLDTGKTDLSKPSGLQVEQLSAFLLQLSWSVPEEDFELADGFLIETFSDTGNINISSNADFDSRMNSGINPSRTMFIPKTDSTLVVTNTLENDSLEFTFFDDSASFNRWNYYRVTIMFDDIGSYSVLTNTGCDFRLNEPGGFNIEQQYDYQLELWWNKSKFADGYKIERLRDGIIDTTYPQITDTTWIDSSYNPDYDILTDTVFSVRGVQPNIEYTYVLTAYAYRDSVPRLSGTISKVCKLNLTQPEIQNTIPINSHTIRLYLSEGSLDTAVFDSLFVLRKYNSQWTCTDTLMINTMIQLFYYYRQQYLIDVNNILEVADYKLVVKGKVNALASDIVSEQPLDVPGFTYVEGGEFLYSIIGADTIISPFYISIYEYTGTKNDSFPPVKGYFPVDNLSWVEAVLICSTLTSQSEDTYRLPSEAEWEYVAKWDIFNHYPVFPGYDYPWRSNSITGDNANYMNSGDPFDNGLTPVGYYDGNNGTIDSFSPFGAYDMGGNVMEWCGSGSLYADLSEINFNDSTYYTGSDSEKPLRGGGYWHDPEQLNTTKQFEYDPEIEVQGFGLRIIMEDTE
ncbi:MAG: formylglycine-generating enzyme family protein [Bacteroidetes bacterium]|nr:formylglycine-generating enzyme family protein [Bacteroidota bacterium]